MNDASNPGPETLTIGDLASRTGVAPATLRMWEQRHGFPNPQRRDSGHRRYSAADVEVVLDVIRRRQMGVRLDVAVEQAVSAAWSDAEPTTPSAYAELRRLHPRLNSYRLRKSTLLALSWAIEDEFCALADRPYLFGAFQHEKFYAHSQQRWEELARVARQTFVFAEFTSPPVTRSSDGDTTTLSAGPASAGALEAQPGAGARPTRPARPQPPRRTPTAVTLPHDAPMRREWTVVCDAPDLSAALTAWELPGQDDTPDRDRVFESLWTVEPGPVRDAARVCARVAQAAGVEEARPVLYELASSPDPALADLASVTAMFNRVVSYVDRYAVR